jgi:hypothetical protein
MWIIFEISSGASYFEGEFKTAGLEEGTVLE